MDSKGTFITVRPKDELVGKYISYYYFHSSDDPGFNRRFFFYPNYKHAVTIYKNSEAVLNESGSQIQPSLSENYASFYSINTDKELSVILKGAFNKIGIVFNPLGLNQFIREPFSDLFSENISGFNYYGDAFHSLAATVFNLKDADEKTAQLDTFFRERYIGFDEPVVKNAVKELLNSNGSIKVDELSEMLEVNRKTLLRLFRKHLCCSVEEYKKLVMFRNALNYSQQTEGSSLTDVALYSLYYDQAHYIKHFKSITGQSPKSLLSRLTQLGNHEVYWNFED
ncbi:MAG: AraC family transcriptional regulator [Flavobacterium sp.]|nr:MAG: AraC family transcriptional regulator [Flavobacterium sp.]